MATSQFALGRRLRWLGAISILSIALIGWWLFLAEPVEKASKETPSVDNRARPEVTLWQGRIVGIEVRSGYPQVLEEFLGVPYALPPTGDRRFRPPLPVKASSAVLDAGKYGYRCTAGVHERSAPQGEDCLTLNIYRPKIRDEVTRLPVVIHIHGGSFNFGAGNTRPVSSLVAWSSEPILGISFNYRIGALGFLPSKLTANEGLLNIGLKDQALLFDWVRENIASFGGDPDNVTLMGNSAGAHSIAIIESGAPTARAVYPYDHTLHEQQFKEFLTLVGCEDVPENHVMTTLRHLPVEDIKKASETIFRKYDPSVRWPWQPVIDGPGGIIPICPIDAWRSGNWNKISILTGFNTNEGAMFVPKKFSTSKQFTDFFRTLLPSLSEEDHSLLNTIYPDPTLNSSSPYTETSKTTGLGAQYKRLEAAYGHFAYTAPVRHTAHFAAPHVPVYLYHFAPTCSFKSGTDHGTHAAFVTYDEDVRDVSETVDAIAGTMHAYWTSFIVSGDPNAVKGRFGSRPRWPVYVPGEEAQIVVFGEGNDEVAGGEQEGVVVEVRDDEWAVEECRFWWERTEKFEM